LPRALYRALGKAFAEGQDWPSAKKSSRHGANTVSSFFAEGRPSAKKCFFFKKNFAEGFPQALGKDIFYFFFKKRPLPRASSLALGKEMFRIF
jgi:hypothetical protein